MAFLRLNGLHYLLRQFDAAFTALLPYLGQSKTAASLLAETFHIFQLCLCVCHKLIQGDYAGNIVFCYIFYVLFQIHNSLFQSFQIFLPKICLRNTTIILKSPYCGNQNHRIRTKATHPALDVKKLFSAEICAKTCLSNRIICQF